MSIKDYAAAVIIGIAGALVGKVRRVRPHPHGTHIWLADVTLEKRVPPVQIVFGGDRKLTGGELVPVAPPGARLIEVRLSTDTHRPDMWTRLTKKMRIRRFRGERSHGMLCSLDELGWVHGGPNEVAILCRLQPGQSLDHLPTYLRSEVVLGWERAEFAKKAAHQALTDMFNPAAETHTTRTVRYQP